MTDIATLGIAINTTQVTGATNSLNQLTGAANSTQTAVGGVGQAANTTSTSLNTTTTATNTLRNATAALISALSVNQIIGYADAWTGAQNSIRQVTRSTAELDEVTQKLRKSAQDSRSGFSTTADLYAKLKRSSEDLGLSQQQLIDVTTTINKSFAASGATAIEAENAIRQLSQGLASGVLRGDEFNSVAEQAPAILRAISAATGTATGDLRKLAAQGAITADVVIQSLQQQANTIDQEFGRSVQTFSQQMKEANDNVTEFLGTSANVQSSVQAIGNAMVSLSENLESISKAAQTLALVGGAVVVVVGLTKAVNLATAAVIALNAATALNPWVALARVVGVAGVAIGTYIGLTEEATDAINKNTKAVDDNTLSFKENGEIVGEINKKSIEASISSLKTEIAILETKNAVIRTNINQLSSLADQYKETASVVAGYNQAIINATVTLDGNINTIRTAEKNLESLEGRFKTWGTTVENAPPKLVKFGAALGGAGKKASGLSKAQKELNRLTKEGQQIFKDTRTPLEAYRIEIQRIEQILAAGKISQETYGRAVQALNEDLQDATGVTKENEDALKALEDQQQKTFDSWSENITDLIGGSKDLGDVLDDLARKLLQDAFVNPLLISVGLGPNGSAGGSFSGGSGVSGGLGDIVGAISGGFNAFGSAANGAFNSFAKSGIGSSLGLSSTSQAFTGAKAGIGTTTSLTGAGDFLSGGFSGFSAGGGLAANLLGLGSGNVLADTVASTLGGAIGTAFGGPIGGAIGSFLGTAVGGLFGGSGDPTTYSFTSQDDEERFEGRNALTLDNEFGETLFKVFAGRSQDKEIVAAMTPILTSISSLESAIAGTLDTDQIARISEGVAGADFRGENADAQVNQFVAVRLGAILQELDPVFTKLSEASETVGVASLAYTTSLVAINEGLKLGGPLLDGFDGNLESTVAFLNQIKTEEQTVTQAFEALAIAQASYYQNFFTEEERFETALTNAQSELDEFNNGLGLFGEAAIDNKQEFRDFIDSIDRTTVAGREALESALGLQGALLFVANAADKAAENIENVAVPLEKIDFKDLLSPVKDIASDAVDSKKEADNAARLALKAVQNAVKLQQESIRSSISDLSGVLSSALSSRSSLRSSDSSTTRLDNEYARDIINRAASGESFGSSVLSSALSSAANIEKDFYSNSIDYQRDFFRTSIDIAAVAESTESQLTSAEQQLSALQEISNNAELELNATLGISDSIMSLSDALLFFAESIIGSKSATVGQAGGTSGLGSGNNGFITNQDIVDHTNFSIGSGGIQSDEDALKIYSAALEHGVSLSQIDAALGLGEGAAAKWAENMGLPAFANGGNHSGGLRVVGERGPELELTGPSRIMSNSDLKSTISGGNNGNKEHESKMNVILSKINLLIDRMYRQQSQWTADGLNVRVVT